VHGHDEAAVDVGQVVALVKGRLVSVTAATLVGILLLGCGEGRW
jgi:hypothetical protein